MCQESVTLSDISCLELVDSVLIRQSLSENGSLSHLMLFGGEDYFQCTGLKIPPNFTGICGLRCLKCPFGQLGNKKFHVIFQADFYLYF